MSKEIEHIKDNSILTPLCKCKLCKCKNNEEIVKNRGEKNEELSEYKATK